MHIPSAIAALALQHAHSGAGFYRGENGMRYPSVDHGYGKGGLRVMRVDRPQKRREVSERGVKITLCGRVEATVSR